MKLVESFLTKNPCYTAGRKITVKGLMLHSGVSAAQGFRIHQQLELRQL